MAQPRSSQGLNLAAMVNLLPTTVVGSYPQPETVAGRIRSALEFVDAERLILAPDFGDREGLSPGDRAHVYSFPARGRRLAYLARTAASSKLLPE